MYSRQVGRPALLVLCGVCAIWSTAGRAQPTIGEVIENVRLSESLVSDVQATFDWTWTNAPYRGEPRPPRVTEGTWSFRNDYRQRLEGTFHVRHSKSPTGYDIKPSVRVFDGKSHRHLYWHGDDPHGVLMPENFEIEVQGPSPKTFLGYGLTRNLSQFSSLADLLEQGTETTISQDAEMGENGCIVVETLVHQPPENNDWQAGRFKVWLDPACGYRPRQIEEYSNAWPALARRLDNIELKEVAPGIWLPVSGRDSFFASKPSVADATLNVKEVLRRPREERFKLLLFEEKLLDNQLLLTVKDYKVNQGLPDSLFAVEFPLGTLLSDHYADGVFVVGNPVDDRDLDDIINEADEAAFSPEPQTPEPAPAPLDAPGGTLASTTKQPVPEARSQFRLAILAACACLLFVLALTLARKYKGVKKV